MQFKKFMFLGAMAAAMASCSSDDVMSEGGNVPANAEKGTLTLSIAMPSAPSSRYNDGDTVAGEEVEQKVSNLTVFVWNADGKEFPAVGDAAATKVKVFNFEASELIPGKPNTSETVKVAYYTTKPMEVLKGQKKVFVVVNGQQTGVFKNITKVSELHTAMTKTRTEIEAFATDNNFVMTNACDILTQEVAGTDKTDTTPVASVGTPETKFYVDGTVAVDVQGNMVTPTTVVVPVERIVAKIQEQTTMKDINVGETKDKVRFTNVALVNGNSKFFPVKKVRFSGESDINYVVDPNFENQWPDKDDKESALTADFYARNFAQTEEGAFDYVKWEPLSEVAKSVVNLFTVENTMTKDEQKNAFTTGLYYKAKYIKDGVSDPKANLYKFKGAVLTFTDLEALADKGEIKLIDSKGAPMTDKFTSADEFKQIGVIKYNEGVCYYPYWIRHLNNGDSKVSSAMEFGVVRNNFYILHVDKVMGIGLPEPVKPDPQTPDEKDGMLEVVVKVMPWTIRDNGIEF